MLADELFQVRRADFFFALDQQRDVNRQSRVRLPRENRFDVTPDLAFIVHGAARKDRVETVLVLSNGWLKRWSRPQIQRLGRLNIVVAIEQNRWPALLVLVLGNDARRAPRGH